MSPAFLLVAALGAPPSAELLDFTAEWCQPCQQMKPIVERLRREGYPIRQVDVDQNRDLASRFRITGIPAFVLVVDGREVGREVGAQSETTLRRLLARLPQQTANSSNSEPEKKGWFELPWNKKREEAQSAAEPPNFDDGADVRAQSQDQRGPAPAPVAPPAAQDPMQTAVRIRVKDARGVDFGSGTIIGSQGDKALVLTCWHIFRDFGETAQVEVDLFPNGPNSEPQTLNGKMVKGNPEADVALVVISGCRTLPVSPIVPADSFPEVGDHVFSVGCGEGKPPTKLQHTVTRLNPYEGPDTTECTGMPVVGRSGGGLFDKDGNVIGVCFAADREDERGVYAGPAEIHKLLDAAGFAALIPPSSSAQVAETSDPPFGSLAASERHAQPASEPASGVSAPSPSPLGGSRSTQPPAAATNRDAIGSEIDPAFASINSPRNGTNSSPSRSVDSGVETAIVPETAVAALDAETEMEATIILRPRNRPDAPSEVIVINKVSNRFRRYLKGEIDPAPVETKFHLATANIEARRAMGERASVRPEPLSGRIRYRRAGEIALLSRVFDNH